MGKGAGSAGHPPPRLGRRLLLFPLPFQGHINPVFQLAALLFQRGFSITVVHTLYNAPDPSGHPHFRFAPIDEGLPEEVLNSDDILAKGIAINKACRAPFRDCLARLLEEAAGKGEDPVACLLADAIFYLGFFQSGEKLGGEGGIPGGDELQTRMWEQGPPIVGVTSMLHAVSYARRQRWKVPESSDSTGAGGTSTACDGGTAAATPEVEQLCLGRRRRQ